MADADHKKFGQAHQGKGDGTGGMTTADPDDIEQGEILSNRDKTQDGKGRGQDGKNVQTAQYEDHPANRNPEDD